MLVKVIFEASQLGRRQFGALSRIVFICVL